MFNYAEIEELKKAAMENADNAPRETAMNSYLEVLIYQNEQILRELNSIGYKLYKMQQDKNV